MFFPLAHTHIAYEQDGQWVNGEAVCLMDWPSADGALNGVRHRLLVVHEDADPTWLDLNQLHLQEGGSHAIRQR